MVELNYETLINYLLSNYDNNVFTYNSVHHLKDKFDYRYTNLCIKINKNIYPELMNNTLFDDADFNNAFHYRSDNIIKDLINIGYIPTCYDIYDMLLSQSQILDDDCDKILEIMEISERCCVDNDICVSNLYNSKCLLLCVRYKHIFNNKIIIKMINALSNKIDT